MIWNVVERHDGDFKETRKKSSNNEEENLQRSLGHSFGDALSQNLVDLCEDGQLTLLDILLGVLQVTGNVVDQMSAFSIVEDLVPESSGLFEVGVGVVLRVTSSPSIFNRVLVDGVSLVGLGGTNDGVGFVVGGRTLVAVDYHGTITLTVTNSRSVRAVDGDLLVVDTQTVTVGIRVREETTLEHTIHGGFNTGNHVGRRESGLLGFGKVVGRVAVQNELTVTNERVISMRPNLGDIEDVPLVLLGISFGHDLDVSSPSSSLARGNVVEEITSSMIRILSAHFLSFSGSEVLDTNVSLVVELNVESFTLFIDGLEGV